MIRVILFALLSTGYAGGCDDAEDLLNACPGAANVTCDDAMCVTAYIKNNCSSALFDAHTAACNIQKDAGVFGENCAVDCADAATLSVTVVLLGSFVFLL